MQIPKTTIIGLGGLGKTLCQTLFFHNIPVISIFNRTGSKAHKIASGTDVNIAATFPTSSDQLGELVFITVSDRAIADVANRLSELNGDFKGVTFVHCSGNESAELLYPVKEKGGSIASFHPLQTFTDQSGPASFEGIYFSMQGDTDTFPLLQKIADKIGAGVFKINEEQKSHLHAAAVMASNLFNVLLDASIKTATLSGLSEADTKEALLPLVETTLQNSRKTSFAEALTGPIKRGDIETVKKHLALLEDHPELYGIYCSLGKQTVELARSSGDIKNDTAKKMRAILQ